jgi:DNA-binding NtrC family response regulator
VLIVDDNQIVRDAIRRMLASEYDTILDAPDIQQGVLVSTDLEVRILILDLILPNREVTANFRDARRRFPRAKVLAITGGGRTGPNCLLTVARKLGAFAVLQKPFRRQALLDTLRESQSN